MAGHGAGVTEAEIGVLDAVDVDETSAVNTSFSGWYDYDTATSHLTPKAGTYVVKAADGAIAWNSLSAAEQQTLQPMKEKWAALPPERQARLRDNAKRWSAMTPVLRSVAPE